MFVNKHRSDIMATQCHEQEQCKNASGTVPSKSSAKTLKKSQKFKELRFEC